MIIGEGWMYDLIAITTAVLWYLGIFITMKTSEIKFSGGTFFYKDYVGTAKNLKDVFTGV
jgi:hypothetical protein